MSMLYSNTPQLPVSDFDPEGPTDQPDRVSQRTPERQLLISLIGDVIAVHRQATQWQDRQILRQYKQDREWILSEAWVPFSFLWTCHHLGIDPVRFRRWYRSEERPQPVHVCEGCSSEPVLPYRADSAR